MNGYHHHHRQQQQGRRPWSGLSRKACANGAPAGDKPFYREAFGLPAGQPRSAAASPLDYAEIFGGFASSCSIPVLQLPPAPDDGPCSAQVDYLEIFGGADPGDFGVPYEEILLLSDCGIGRASKEMKASFTSAFVSGSGKEYLKDNNDMAFLNKQFTSTADPQSLSSSFGVKNQKTKVAETVDRNIVHDVQPFTGFGACAIQCEIPSVNGTPTANIISNSACSVSCTKRIDNGPGYDHIVDLKLPGSAEDIQTNEQYHSCSSSEKSAFEDVDSFPDCSDNSPSSNVEVTGVSVKDANPGRASYMSFSSEDKELIPPAKESMMKYSTQDVYPRESLVGNSSLNPPSASVDNFLNLSSNSCRTNINSVERIVEKASASEAFIAEKDDGFQLKTSNTSEDKFSIKGQNMQNLTAIDEERSNYSTFFKVSDISFLTEPCQVPPPSRPPPKLVGTQGYPKVMMATNKQKVRSAIEIKNCKEPAKWEEPSFSDIEVNASSAAAASVAAMKEAIELAELQLRSAKGLLDRKKDSFHRQSKTVNETMKIERKAEEPALVGEIVNEANIPDDREKCYREGTFIIADGFQRRKIDEIASRHFVIGDRPQSRTHHEESVSLQPKLSNVHPTSLGQWKVGDQFYEFVNDEMSFTRVSEISDHDSGGKRSEVSAVTSEVENLDTEACKLAEKQERNDGSIKSDLVFEVDCSDEKADKSSGFSIFPKVEALEVAPKLSSNDSLPVYNDLPENQLDSVQQDICLDNDNAENEKLETTDCEKEDECTETHNSEGSFVGEPEANNVKEVLESCTLDEKNEDDLFEKECMLDEEILNSHTVHKSFEHEEIAKELEGSMPEGFTELDKDEFLDVLLESRDESYHHKEDTEITLEETDVVSEKDEYQTSGETLKGCEHKDEAEFTVADVILEPSIMGFTKNAIGSGNVEHIFAADSLSCSVTEQEEQTKEPCWQHFCEKLIGKTEGFHEDDKNVDVTNIDEQKFTRCTRSEFEENHGSIPNNIAEDNESNSMQDGYACKFQDHGRLRTSEKASCSDDDANGSNDGISNMPEECSVNASKLAGKTIGDQNETEEESKIPEISEPNETLKEERNSRELKLEKERLRKLEEQERAREREKDRQAVDGPDRGSRERAFAETQERAEKVAVDRATAEARQRALAEAREKAEKASNEALLLAEKASREAKLRAERAAVERATAEARERAVERALAEKAAQEARERAERPGASSRDWQRKENGVDYAKDDVGTRKNVCSFDPRDSREGQRYSNSSHHVSNFNDKLGGHEGESDMRCKARLERHQRTVERAAKALAEKNLRDTLAQREQAERNRLADTLDSNVRRWSSGKEGNLRALLSTLQYILGPDSGWQPITLTEVLTAAAVKKAYRKATLCVHPDKLQQRGASIQQKYICEKVFDLLKEAWNRFNSEER